jgi:hypothetical protein
MSKEEMVFADSKGKRYFPSEVVFCDIDTPGAQFMGYVTLESFRKTNCIDNWVRVKAIPEMGAEYRSVDGSLIVKGVKYHRQT